MATMEETKNKVAKTNVNSMFTLIQDSVKELGKALPSHMNAERMVRIALTTIRMNPKLQNCTPQSFLGALFQSAQLGLEPNIEGQAYIIPYQNKRKDAQGNWTTQLEAGFQIGYKGYIELFFRHESSISLDMQEVKENDEFSYEYGTESFLKHRPAMKNRSDVIGYYAVAKMKNGASIFKFMSVEECTEHGKKFSKCFDKKSGIFYKDTPWETAPDAMGKKTVLIQLMKLLPKSIEIQRALAMDDTIKTKVSADMFTVTDEAQYTDSTEEVENKTEQVEKEDVPVVSVEKVDTKRASYIAQMNAAKDILGDKYYEILGSNGFETAEQITDYKDFERILKQMREIVSKNKNPKA